MPAKPQLAACLTALIFSLLNPSQGSAQDELKPMFNGKDFSGWVRTNTPAETWSFHEGVLVCTGKPIGEIRTAKMYQNFIMELEWRHMVPRGNAGVFIWADDITARGVPFHRGIEVQILENAYGNNNSHTTHGDIFPIHGAKMTPINGHGGSRAFPSEERSKPSPEWNHYRIEGRHGEISLAVNGKVVTRGQKCSPSKGYICLESEGGVVEYRNVMIQELPNSSIPAEQVAIADRGYMSIYNGLNLDTWIASDNPKDWKSKDWVLSYTGALKSANSLRSQAEYTAPNLVVDVRLQDPASTVVLGIGTAVKIDLADPAVAKHLEPMGKWNRIERARQGEQFELRINGQTVDNATTHAASGPIILMPSGPVDFANIYVGDRREFR